MIRIRPPEDEVESLEQGLRTTADARLRHRARIVLMAHRGRRHPEITADTGTMQRPARRRLNAYFDGAPDRSRLAGPTSRGSSPE